MDWHHLGHAMWLAELGGVRVLFDPLIDGVHHGGVFEVDPPREIDLPALRPDFIVVSHQHPDHFDLPSLAKLADHDPEAVIFTADDLVAYAAKRLGFRTVAPVETFSRIDLDGARLCSTPSYTDEVEWGLMVETREGVVWNQIDSFQPEQRDVARTLDTASKIFERDLRKGLPLALVRWQPVLEAAGPLAQNPGFPFEEYANALGRIAAIGAQAVVPSAAGVRQTAPYAWMNHYVYPVPFERVARDIPLRAPGTRVFPAVIGGTYRVREGRAAFDPAGARELVSVPAPGFSQSATTFRPLEMPALRDPNLAGHDEAKMRPAVERWLRETLLPALAGRHPDTGVRAELRYVVEVVFPSATDVYTLRVSPGGGTSFTRGFDESFDALNVIAGSMLFDVIEGRRNWADPLLGGMYRACNRAYDLNEDGLLIAKVSPTFLYYGLSYAESVKRAVEWQLSQLRPG